MLHGKHLQNRGALIEHSARIVDVGGKLAVFSVSSSSFDRGPLFKCQSNVLKSDSFGTKEESDGLGTSLKREVYNFWHFVVVR